MSNKELFPLLCEAWGETDLPAAFIAHNEADLRHFITVEWAPGKCETEGLIEFLERYDWRDLGDYSFEFEIGGMSFKRVYETARPALNPERKTLHVCTLECGDTYITSGSAEAEIGETPEATESFDMPAFAVDLILKSLPEYDNG